jgi:hypothetical protein
MANSTKPKDKNPEINTEIKSDVKIPKKRGRKSKKELAEIAKQKALELENQYILNGDENLNVVLAEISKNADKILDQEKEEEKALPKKRGRKAKNKIFDFNPNKDNNELPKKRGRKPKEKFGILPPKPNEVTEDYILLKLPIHSKDLEEVEFTGDKILRYSDKIDPDPSFYSPELDYQKLDLSSYSDKSNDINSDDINPADIINNIQNENIQNENIINLNDTIQNLPPSVPDLLENNITKIINERAQPVEYTKQELQKRFENIKEKKPGHIYESRQTRQIRLMVQFQEVNRRGEWPHHTKLYCFWCCHSFECIPWGIPLKYSNNIFHVDGNFCSPECGAAYNFDQKDFKMWERYMLLNLLYNKVIYPKYQKLKLAPPRRMLVQYGGNMTIEDFRRYCQNYTKDYLVNFPPMVSVPTVAEEINLSEHFRQKVIYMDQTRIDDASRRCQEQEKELMDHDKSLYRCFDRIATTGN